MSSCETVHELLEQARDESLPPLVQAALESHLGSCPDCARLSVLEQELSSGFAALRAEDESLELPPDFRRRVKERLIASDRSRSASTTRWAGGFSAGLAAAACLVLAVVAVFALRGSGAREQPATVHATNTPVQSPALELDSREAPLLYSTNEVEVIFDDSPLRRFQPAGAMQPVSADADERRDDEAPRRGPREYHF